MRQIFYENIREYNWSESTFLSVILGLFFFFLGGIIGYEAFAASGFKLNFYQFFSPETFASACGKGWSDPGLLQGALYDFSLNISNTLDCRYFDEVAHSQGPGLFTRLHWYTNLLVKSLLSPPILNYGDLWPLPTIIVGLYVCGCFILLRLFLSVWLSTLGATIIAWSPLLASLTPSLRDLSKAPFLIWSIVCLILLLRSKSAIKSFSLAIVTGCIVGIGTGFRSDVGILVPIGATALLLCTDFKILKLRLIATVTLYVSFMVAISPLNLPDNIGGGWGSVVQQGMSRPIKERLILEPSIYELGWMYSDELSLSSIAATERMLRPEWDLNESLPRQGFTQALRYSGDHISKWAIYFVSDFYTRALKSIYRILSMPSLIGESKIIRPALLAPISKHLKHSYGNLNPILIASISLFGLFILVAKSSISATNQTVGLLVIFGGTIAAPALQFSLRHAFHLEFFWVLGLLTTLSVGFRIGSVPEKLIPAFTKLILASLAIGLTIYYVLTVFQQHNLSNQFEKLLALKRVNSMPQISRGTESATMLVNVPPEHLDIISAAHDSMTSDIVRKGNQWDVRAEADRMLLTMKNCPSGKYLINTIYTKSSKVWQPFDQTLNVTIQQKLNGARLNNTAVLLPAFYRPTQYFSGVKISPAPTACNFILEKLEGSTPFPYLMTVIFAPDWRSRNLFYGIGAFY